MFMSWDYGLNLTRNINIEGHHLIPNLSIQFVRDTSPSLEISYTKDKYQFIIDLNRCVRLIKIRHLNINYANLNTGMLIEILCCMSNLNSLSLYYRPLQHIITQSVKQEAQIIHLMSKNKITKVIITGVVNNMLEDFSFFINLCPRIQ